MYNKLFTKILDSSIWLESTPTRLLWMVLIAAMDEDGFCAFASIPNLAHRARLSVEETTAGIESLEAADPNSSDPDNDGRRVERVQGGWIVLNAKKYREMVTRTVVREQTRARVARHREKRNGNADVTASNEKVTPSEADTNAEAEAKSHSPTNGASLEDLAERERENRLPTTETAIRIAKLFNRRLTTAWSRPEIKAYRNIQIDTEDLALVERYYSESGSKYLRRDIGTFLNNFTGEVDRARTWENEGGVSKNGDYPEEGKMRIITV
jgi:hypothetical protein